MTALTVDEIFTMLKQDSDVDEEAMDENEIIFDEPKCNPKM